MLFGAQTVFSQNQLVLIPKKKFQKEKIFIWTFLPEKNQKKPIQSKWSSWELEQYRMKHRNEIWYLSADANSKLVSGRKLQL